MLNKRYLAAITIIAAAAISTIPLMNVTAEEREVRKVNEIMYSANMPLIVDMKPGETRIIPVEITTKSALTVDLFISAKGKEDIARYDLAEQKFTDAVSATISKQRSIFDAADQADTIDIVVTVSENAEPGVHPLTLQMAQKAIGITNVLEKYLYINVE